MAYAEKIKKLRDNLGISQKKLGEILELSQESIAGYETGRREPSRKALEKMLKLAKAKKIKFSVFD